MLWRLLSIVALLLIGALATDRLFNLSNSATDSGFIGGLLLAISLWAIILIAVLRLFKGLMLNLLEPKPKKENCKCKSDSSSQAS